MTGTQELFLGLGVIVGTPALMIAAVYLSFPSPRKPKAPERTHLEKLHQAITAAIHSSQDARVYVGNDMGTHDEVKAMRDRLDYARDNLRAAQRAAEEWLLVANAHKARDRAA